MPFASRSTRKWRLPEFPKASDTPDGYSLSPETIRDIFRLARPLGHNERPETCNLGFGFLYYGLVRAVRPEHVVVIGSGFGFSVVCLALGLKDNARGLLTFVDPSYDVFRHGPFRTMGGRGKWSDPEGVAAHFDRFGLGRIVTHHRMTSEAFFRHYPDLDLPRINIAFIDGNHAYASVKHDFLQSLKWSGKNTYILLHDTHITIREMIRHSGVKRWLGVLKRNRELFEGLDFPFSSGVAVVRVLRDNAWKYLGP